MEGMETVNEDFQIDKSQCLGKGNYGTVYKGYQLSKNCIVAIKHIHIEKLKEVKDWERQLKVMSNLTTIHHPNVMGYYGHQKKADGLYMFVQFCKGGSLKQFFSKQKMSEVKVFTIFKQLLDTMTAMNSLGLIHRDLKPDNLMLDEHQNLKIADFGLARKIGLDMTKGACTPLYASPQMLGLQPYTEKCDVWSAGLILFELLTSKEMFAHVRTKLGLVEEIKKFIQPNKKINYPKDIHPLWQKITLKMMTFDKEKRPDFKEMKKQFQIQYQDTLKKYLVEKFGVEFTEFQEGDDLRITRQVSPYQSKPANIKTDLQTKYIQEKSFQNINNVRFYNLFLRAKNDYRIKIIKDFTKYSYSHLRNVYKYVLMFLATGSYISILTQNLTQMKAKKLITPQSQINESHIIPQHKQQFQRLLQQFLKKNEQLLIKLKKKVLQAQIISKIMDTYMIRPQQKSIILNQCYNVLDFIKDIRQDKIHSSDEYDNLFRKIATKPVIYVNNNSLQDLSHDDMVTYTQIVITMNIDKIVPNDQYKNTDYVSSKQQEIQSMSPQDLVHFITLYNH